MLKKNFISHDDVQLEVLETIGESEVALIFVHGMGGNAHTWKEDLSHYHNMKAYSLSLRGRGKSSAPEKGYSFQNHISDIEALINHFQIKNCILIANSAGVAWSLGYCLKNPEIIKGLVLIDHAAVNIPVNDDWVSWALNDENCTIAENGVKGLQQEYEFVNLYPMLSKIKCPIKLMKGMAEGSHLTNEDINDYQGLVSDFELIELPHSGHGVSDKDEEIFWKAIDSIV